MKKILLFTVVLLCIAGWTKAETPAWCSSGIFAQSPVTFWNICGMKCENNMDGSSRPDPKNLLCKCIDGTDKTVDVCEFACGCKACEIPKGFPGFECQLCGHCMSTCGGCP